MPNNPDVRREYFSPRANNTETSGLNGNTTLALNKYKIYHKYIYFCIKNDALKINY